MKNIVLIAETCQVTRNNTILLETDNDHCHIKLQNKKFQVETHLIFAY